MEEAKQCRVDRPLIGRQHFLLDCESNIVSLNLQNLSDKAIPSVRVGRKANGSHLHEASIGQDSRAAGMGSSSYKKGVRSK